MEQAERHAQRLAGRRVAAGHGQVAEVAGAAEASGIAEQEFPPPDPTVGAVADAVEDHPDRLLFHAVFGQAGGQVGVVVLHRQPRQIATRFGVAGRGVVGMEIVGDQLRGDAEDLLQVVDGSGEGILDLGVLQIADVLAQISAIALGEADGVLQLGAEGQHLRLRPGEEDAPRHVAPGATQQQRLTGHDPGDRIVAAGVDRAVVTEDGVGDAGQTFPRFVVAVGDRFVAAVGAGHHQRWELLQQQVVEGGVGEHHPEITVARRHLRGDGVSRLLAQQHDRPLHPGEEAQLGVVGDGELEGLPARGRHQGEGLFVPGLAPAQFGNGRVVAGIDRQVVAAEPLDGDDPAGLEQGDRRRERFAGERVPGGGDQLQPRAALGTGVGLGVKAPGGGIDVLGATGRAHGEIGHGGQRPVVGNAGDDAVARAAVGAVDERVAETAVGGVEEFGQAVGADAAIRGRSARCARRRQRWRE